MPKKSKRNHSDNRKLVCLLCFQKGSSMTMIANKTLDRVKTYWFENYESNDERLPNGICGRCRILLEKVEKGVKKSTDLPECIDYNQLHFPKLTRSSGNVNLEELIDCNCSICEVSKGPSFYKKVSPYKVGRPVSKPKTLTIPISRCSKCLQVIGKGISHPKPCGIRQRRDNIEDIYSDDPRGAEILASKVIKEKAISAFGSTISLSTAGPSLTLSKPSVPPSKATKALYKDQPIPAEELKKMMIAQNMSLNQMKRQTFLNRAFYGRNSVESGSIEKIRDMDKALEPFFTVKPLDFDSSNKDERTSGLKVNRSLVYCHDISGLLTHICKARNLENIEVHNKIGIDGGGGFLKVCLNVQTFQNIEEGPEKKQSTFSYTEGAFAKEFKNSSVNKLMILAIVENVCENYNNLKMILELLGLDEIDSVNAFDMKLANAFIGIGTAASTYPCPWCISSKDEFRNENFMYSGKDLRTLGDIRSNSKLYNNAAAVHTGKNKLSSAAFFNCEKPPLSHMDDSTYVISIIPPMELHFHLGVVNKLYDQLDVVLIENKSTKTAKDWSDKVGVNRPKHHGGEFNGNQCSRLLSKIEWIKDLIHIENLDSKVSDVYDAFNTYSQVKSACFGQQLDLNYKGYIEKFGEAYIKLGKGIPPKVHGILAHVDQFLSLNPGKALGFWSEQASESVHYDFSTLWINGSYKRAISHDQYESRLLKCVVTYNSRHI